MTYLLDVNVLIALIDSNHVGHGLAHSWFVREGGRSWATCPATENGLLRIVGHPKYPNSPGSPAAVSDILARMRNLPGHCFWSDDLSLVEADNVVRAKILTSAQVTDTYLLALARSKGGKLATLDRRLSTKSVLKGSSALYQIKA